MAVSLRLPDDLNIRLSNLADKTGRSKTFYMLEAIRDHLDDLEDLYLAEQRLMDRALDDGYRAMAADKAREAEAIEWCNALAEDMADAAR